METKQYYPSNGTEGMIFTSEWCDLCYKEKQCTILTNSMLGKQPKQWIYDKEGNPTCTSYNSNRPKKQVKKILNQLNLEL